VTVAQSPLCSVYDVGERGMSKTNAASGDGQSAVCSDACRYGLLPEVGAGDVSVVLARRTTSTSLLATRLVMHCGDSAPIAVSCPSKPETATGIVLVEALNPRLASVGSHGFEGSAQVALL
jgi:hypothetical protein